MPRPPCSPTVTKSGRIFARLRPLRSQAIKCHFQIGSEPLWAWVSSVFDGQDAINELFNCILRVVRISVEEFFNFILPEIESERVAVRMRRRPKLIAAFWKQAELF